MYGRRSEQSGQATMELAVLLIAFTAMILGIIFVGGLGIARNEALLEAKAAAEVSSRTAAASVQTGGNEYLGWSYTSLDLYGDGSSSIPFTAGDVVQRGGINSLGVATDELHRADRSVPVDIYVDDVLYTYDYVFMDLEALNSSLFDHDFVTALRGGTNAFDAAALDFAAPGSRPPVALLDSRDQQGAKNSAVDAYSKMFESFTGWFGVSFDSFSITDDVSGRVAMPRSPVVK